MADMIAAPGDDPPLGETERERLNRNFNELLQELRVLQTGVQILFAFMLTLPFAAGFDRLSDVQRDVYGLSLLLVANEIEPVTPLKFFVLARASRSFS